MSFDMWYVGEPHRGLVFGTFLFDCVYMSRGSRYHGLHSDPEFTYDWQMFDQSCNGPTDRYVCEIPANSVKNG